MTKTVTIVAAGGALLVSVGAARSNPGRFTSPPKVGSTVASGRPAHHHRRVRSDTSGTGNAPQQATSAPPAATNPPAVTNPPAATNPPAVTTTPAPPVVVSGGS